MIRALLWLALTALLQSPLAAQSVQEIVNKAPNGLAPTPPMGWNSWNKFACNVNEQTVRDTLEWIRTRKPVAA